MTRIIAGFAGSRSIAVPGSGTRPTSERVREAVFSALEARGAIAGMHVLDLYAGSGALGLEAASRGAASVVLVDRDIRTAKANAARILTHVPRGAHVRIQCVGEAVQAYLDSARGAWDLVFLDPPYALGEAELARNLEALVPNLAPGALVVLERSSRSPEPAWPHGLEPERRKDYGDTTIHRAARA